MPRVPEEPPFVPLPVCPEPDQLKPALERVETELDARLAEACTRHGADESTGELIKLEEILTDAAHAAKEAISIRRRLGVEREKASSSTASGETAAQGQGGVRSFADSAGRDWQVWEVPPEQLSARSRPGAYAGDYESGWLAFGSTDGRERRRLPHYPREWRSLDETALEGLCRQAAPVTRRRTPAPPGRDTEDEESQGR